MKTKHISLIVGIPLVLGLVGFVRSAEADVFVRGYYNPSIGTYIAPHYRTSPNNTLLDNYSTKGNYNPYTGEKGYKSPYNGYENTYKFI